MIKNDVVLMFFVLYAIMLPLIVSNGKTLRTKDSSFLIFFDFIFIFDRLCNLCVGYINKEGKAEPRIWIVVYQNLNFSLLIEILVTVIPIYIGLQEIYSLYFFIFKIFRYVRMMEMETQINEIIDYFAESMTVFELKKLHSNLVILQFTLQTTITIHLLTCMMITVCTHRDYKNSWISS